jgi:hypothetical protein
LLYKYEPFAYSILVKYLMFLDSVFVNTKNKPSLTLAVNSDTEQLWTPLFNLVYIYTRACVYVCITELEEVSNFQ